MVRLHALAGDPRGLHRVDLRIEDNKIDVPDEDRQRRKDRFIQMNRGGDIQKHFRNQLRKIRIRPQQDARCAHDHGAPHHRPVFCLFDVVVGRQFRSFARQAHIVCEAVERFGNIRVARDEVEPVVAEFPVAENRDQVDAADSEHHRSRRSVDRAANRPGALPVR